MIYEYLKYKTYLESKLGKKGTRTGLRKRLSESLNVHTTFVSQVFLGKADFSLEQAEGINNFLNHTEDEGEYFILLVLKDRAGTKQLKKRFLNQINKEREIRLNIEKRLDVETKISEEDRVKFYSNYYYAAVHVLASIPEFNTTDKIAKILKINEFKTNEIINFLVRLGILKKNGSKLLIGSNHVHLGNDSSLILKHHSNWRMHTLSNLNFINKNDLHYSACLSLSKNDAQIIKESILKTLQENIKIVSKSAEETAYVYSFDFYSMIDSE